MSALLLALHKAVAKEHLSASEARAGLDEILGGDAPSPVVAALLVALRMKGEAVEEVEGFARALRDRAIRVECKPDARPLVDTCGTGGDGGQTFNVSTAAAFVLAGAGARVAKHGNRSISSRCGSADVIEELGAVITLPPASIARCIEEVGIGFLFAPALHPAMGHVQPIRAQLKMRTVFNLLGPLANPAGADTQVMGVFEPGLVPLAAGALARLGMKRGLVVHSRDGLDEISTRGETLAAEIAEGEVKTLTLRPEDFGVGRASGRSIQGGDRRQNAAIIRGVLGGKSGPQRDIVLMNAAAALVVAGLAVDWRAGMELARQSIDSGRAAAKLERFVRFTRAAASG